MNDNVAKECSKPLVVPTGKTTDRMALKSFQRLSVY